MLRYTLFTLLLLAEVIAVDVANATTFELSLKEPIGRDWQNERIRHSLPRGALTDLPRDVALVDGAGQEVPYEIVPTDRGTSIEILADLKADTKRTFHFDATRKASDYDNLQIVEDRMEIILRSSKAGVKLRRACAANEGPIAAFKHSGEGWLHLRHEADKGDTVIGCKTRVLRRGPVIAAAESIWAFSSGIQAQFTFEIQANDEAIQISEVWSKWLHPTYILTAELKSNALNLYYRKGQGSLEGTVSLDRVHDIERLFELEPWHRWWIAERRGTWVAAVAEDQNRSDALILSALRAPEWISEDDVKARRFIQPIRLSFRAGQLDVHFPSSGMKRVWLAALAPRKEVIDPTIVGERRLPPPQRLKIKHSDFPLDRLKDWVLEWPQGGEKHTPLMLTDHDIARFRSWQTEDASRDISQVPINEYNLARLFRYYYITNDSTTRHRLSQGALPAMRSALDEFLNQTNMYSLGFAPHHLTSIIFAVHLADIAMANPSVSTGEKEQLRRLSAVVSYILHLDDFWSQKRGFSANPNMSSIVASYQGLLACQLRDHPEAERWLNASITELFDNELLGWSDANGGWLEAPHYAIVSLDAIIGVLLCARNAGRPDLLSHPRLRRVTEWLAKTTTPPDVRADMARMLAPIGNTYMLEPTGIFGTLAYLFRTIDPVFSAKMQWMHQASGSPVWPSVGGFPPTIAPYQMLFKDPGLPAAEPDFASELFPKTGAILRSHFATERETQVHVIAGSNHAHYDQDSGSITLWGKGRVLANDWGYTGYGPSSEHSMIDSGSIASWMDTVRYKTGEVFDHYSGISGAWRRDIRLIKDKDPLGANFVILSDTLASEASGKWRLWLTCERLEHHDWGVKLVGRDDVDMAVVFLDGLPSELRFETRTLRSAASLKGALDTTQTAIMVPMPKGGVIRVLLLPYLKTELRPEVIVSNYGKVVSIRSSFGFDQLFLAPSFLEYNNGNIKFKGTVGIVRVRERKMTLSVEGRGRIEAEGRVLWSARDDAVSFHRFKTLGK